MKKQIQTLFLLFSLLASVMHAKAGPGTGAGSVTADNSIQTSTATDVHYIYSETWQLGPAANWQVSGTIYFYGKNIRIAPGAVLAGTGKIVLMDPADNPFWADMTAAQTTIDGNNGGFIDLNIEHRNPAGALLANLADAGYNADGADNSLKIGKDLLLGVDGANITLSSALKSDLVFDNDATISGYRPARMIVTGNLTSHVVKQNYTGAFTFPVGIASGDYTPARLNNTVANTLHVSVQDYASSSATEAGTDGIQRTWNIFADNAAANTTVGLQHNMATEQAGFNTASNFVTQYSASAPNISGNSGIPSTSAWQSNTPLAAVKTPATAAYTSDAAGMSSFSINSGTYTNLPTTATAQAASFSKASSTSSPLGISVTAPPAVTGINPVSPGSLTGAVDLTAITGSYPPTTPVVVTYLKPDLTTVTFTGSTDGTGKIRIPNLPAGTYKDFTVAIDGINPSLPAGNVTLTDPAVATAPPTPTGINPTSPGTATGAIDLTATTGTYPPTTPVVVTYLKPDLTTVTFTGSTDATGKIRIPNLPAGTYKDFTVAVNGGSASTKAGTVTLVDPAAVTAPPAATGHNPTTAGTATGSVDLVGTTGPYPSNTAVTITYIKPDLTTGNYTGSTDGSGKINIPNLPAGTYKNFTVAINGGPASAPGGNVTLVDPGTVADMVPSLTYTGSTFMAVAATKTVTIRVSNIIPNTNTTGAITIRVFKPTAATGMSFVLNATPEWDVVTSSLYYDLTLKAGLNINSTATAGFRQFTGILTRTGGASGTYLLNVLITNGSGGETNYDNNSQGLTITKL